MSVDYRPDYDPADVDSDYGHTGGNITVPTFTGDTRPFRFWCQKALPLVYDDSLSYYEVLCKMADYMNNFVTDLTTVEDSMTEFGQQFVINQQFLNSMADQLGQNVADLEAYINDRMDDFMTAYTQLQTYVNNYFDNLDVQEEINTKLDEMASDGTLNNLFDPVLETWMQQKTAQIDAAIANQDTIQAAQNARISVLEGRMDTFSGLPSGSTSGNAELLDIRTNFLGETYPTAGDAVRASDMIASGFLSIPFTRLEEWNGNASSNNYDTIQFDVSAYKGGHVVMIANMDDFILTAESIGVGVFATNVSGKTADQNAHAYALTSTVFPYYSVIPTQIAGEERIALFFSIPEDFNYQYLKMGYVQEIPNGDYTQPAAIVYANSWSKTQVDPTLEIAGAAADAKATGDALDELNERIGNAITNDKNLFEDTATKYTDNLVYTSKLTSGYYINASTGNETPNASWYITDYIPLRSGLEYAWIGISSTSFGFYDIEKKFIDLRGNSDTCENNNLKSIFSLPNGVFYGRFSVHVNDLNKAIISENILKYENYTISEKMELLNENSFKGLNAQSANRYISGDTSLDVNMYKRGFLKPPNYIFSTYNLQRRALSAYPEEYPFDIVFTPDANTNIVCAIYNSDGTITTTSTTYAREPIRISANTKFRLEIQHSSDTTLEDICNGVSVSIPVDIIDDLPSYYFTNNYITNKIDDIIDKSPLDGLQFAFITDIHIGSNSGKSPYLIKYIKEKTNSLPFVVSGGDILSATVPNNDDILSEAKEWQKWMEYMDKSHVYQAQGNHDYTGFYYVDNVRTGFSEPLSLCRQFVLGNLEDANIINAPGKTWYCLNIPTANTKIVFLNDYDTSRNDDGFAGYAGTSVDQINWVLTNVLNDDNIRVIFVSHETYDSEMEGTAQVIATHVGFQRLFKAIVNKEVYSYGALSRDFTNSNITFVAHLCGHMHADASNVNEGVLTIQTTCDGIMTGVTGRTDGTITEQAFDIITVDYTNSKLYLTRIGGGNDREFSIS